MSRHRQAPVKPRTEGKPRDLKHGANWSFVNTVATKFAAMAVTIVVVRIISPHQFGVFAVAIVVYIIVAAFGELGLSASIARRDMDPAVVGPVVTAMSMVSYFALAAAMALSAGPLAASLGAPEAKPAIQVLSISIFLSSFTSVSSSVLTRDFRQGRLFAATVISFFPSNAVLILLALSGDGALAFAWSRVVGQVVAAIVIISASHWYAPRWNRAAAVVVLKLGVPLAGANLLNYVLLNADTAFIAKLLGPTLLGIYTLAFNVASWSTSVLGGTINGVAMPAFSALRGDRALLESALSRWSRLASVIAFPVCTVTAVLAPELVEVIYGKKWAPAGPVLAILAVYGGVFVISLLLSNLLVGVGRTTRVFVIQAVWLCTLLPSIWLGVAWMGVEGAALAHVAVIILVVIPAYFLALRGLLPGVVRLMARAIGGPLVAAVLAAGVGYISVLSLHDSLPRLLVGGSVSVVVYFAIALPWIITYIPAALSARLERTLAIRLAIPSMFSGKKVRA